MRAIAITTTVLAFAACSAAPGPKPAAEPAPEPAAVAQPASASGEATGGSPPTECTKVDPIPMEPAEPVHPPPEPVEDPLEELSALGDQVIAGDPDAGGSIRAKKEPPLDELRADPCRLRARVDQVIRGEFPLAAVRVRVLDPPRDGPGKDLSKNDVIVVLPRLVTERGRVKVHHPPTARNAGVFYLSKGDRVLARLQRERADGLWWVEVITRE